MLGDSMVEGDKNHKQNMTVQPNYGTLQGPTDDDYEEGGNMMTNTGVTPDATLYPYNTENAPELSDLAEKLCESDTEITSMPDCTEILNGESFLVHGEMTIATDDVEETTEDSPSEDDSVTQVDPPYTPPPESSSKAANQLTISPKVVAHIVEDVFQEEPPRALPVIRRMTTIPNKSPAKQTGSAVRSSAVRSSAKYPLEYHSKTPGRPTQNHTKQRQTSSEKFIDLTKDTDPIRPPPPRPPCSTVFKSLTKNRPVTLNCHYYGTKRKQQVQKPASVCTIGNHDSTSKLAPKAKQQPKLKPSKCVISLADDDVFEYTPSSQTTSTTYEKVIKNEDRYTKFELGRIANEKHKKVHEKTLALNEKTRLLRECERKLMKMRITLTKLTEESTSKDKEIETKCKELADLESSKADNEIFIKKLEGDIESCQKQTTAKDFDLECHKKEFDDQAEALNEQKRVHRNLTAAHNVTLRKIKTLKEMEKKANMCHTNEILEKELTINKLEVDLTHKSISIDSLVRDKSTVDNILFKMRHDLETSGLLNSAKDSRLIAFTEQIKSLKEKLASYENGNCHRNLTQQPSTLLPDVKHLHTFSEPARLLNHVNESKFDGVIKTPAKPAISPAPPTRSTCTLRATTLRTNKRKVCRSNSVSTPIRIVSCRRKRAKSAISTRTEHLVLKSKRKRIPSKRYTTDFSHQACRGRRCPAPKLEVPIKTEVLLKVEVPVKTEPQEQNPESPAVRKRAMSVSQKDISYPKAGTVEQTPVLDEPSTVTKVKPKDNLVDKSKTEKLDGDKKNLSGLEIIENIPVCSKQLPSKEYFVTDIQFGGLHREDLQNTSLEKPGTHIEIPSFRLISPILLIHEEGVQGSKSRCSESDSLENYVRMHKKCETKEIRMMKKCEKMRLKLDHQNKRNRLKSSETALSHNGTFFCQNKEHPVFIEKSKQHCVSAFQHPIRAVKQKDFMLPWCEEITSFAYMVKSSSRGSTPASAISPEIILNHCITSPSEPSPPTESLNCQTNQTQMSEAAKSQIILTFSQSEHGIIVKSSDPDFSPAPNEHSSDTSILSPTKISVVHGDTTEPSPETLSAPINSTNIWSDLSSTSLDNCLNKISLLSKLEGIRKSSSSSGESTSNDLINIARKRVRPLSSSSDDGEKSSPTKIAVEQRNLWSDWCPTKQNADQPDDKGVVGPISFLTSHRKTLSSQTDDSLTEDLEIDESCGAFDRKSFLLDVCTSNLDRPQTLPPQPLTEKLNKLSKHKKPLLVYTNHTLSDADVSPQS